MTDSTETAPVPTIASELPPKTRRAVYAVLGSVVPTVLVAVAVLKDGFQPDDLAFILPVAATSSGFPLALSNTPRT